MSAGVRTYGLALAVAVLTLVVGGAGRITWKELRQLHQNFASIETEAFHLSEHVDASIRDLNDTVLRFEWFGDLNECAEFLNEARELKQWIRAHQETVTTEAERELMGRIDRAFESYLSQATSLISDAGQSGAAVSPGSLLEQVENRAGPILELCENLNVAERAAQSQFMVNSRRALTWLEQLLVVQLGLLLALVGTGVVAVYRGVIGPLRVELGASRARVAQQEKLASLGTLAAGVAHEIRNPLTAINVRLHSLKRNLAGGSSEQEDALVIGHEIQRLERIVQEFLQFARPMEPKFLSVSVDSLLARVKSLFEPQLQKACIRLDLESAPDIWVRVDPHQFEQVLINLIQNAVESMENGGTITMRARTGIRRLSGQTLPAVMLEVSDTGKGITPEVRKRMFDPFFTTKEEGTGLGLAISLRILEKHGGTIECRSEVNRGTTFTVLLPNAAPGEPDEPAT